MVTKKSGETLRIGVGFENTANASFEYFLGISLRSPSGAILDIPMQRTTLNAKEGVTMWTTTPALAAEGNYAFRTSVWSVENPTSESQRLADSGWIENAVTVQPAAAYEAAVKSARITKVFLDNTQVYP